MAAALVDFRRADIAGRMDDLPLQIGERDRVVVDHAERADAGGCQIHQHGGAKPARADDQHAGALERGLARPADLAQHDVARVALQFLGRQHRLLHRHSRSARLPPFHTTRLAHAARRRCSLTSRGRHGGLRRARQAGGAEGESQGTGERATQRGQERASQGQAGRKRRRRARAPRRPRPPRRSWIPTTPFRSPSASRSRAT